MFVVRYIGFPCLAGSLREVTVPLCIYIYTKKTTPAFFAAAVISFPDMKGHYLGAVVK